MKIAVAGGTGVVGRHIVAAIEAQGDVPVVLARARGVDLLTGVGVDAALEGADAVIDASNVATRKADAAAAFFRAATATLVAASTRAGVRHLVSLSIVGIDRMPHEYYAGKLAQEQVVQASSVPWTTLRATQFHEFAGQVYAQAVIGPLHVAPRARVQPIAAREVGIHLARIAAGAPQGRAADLGGPREEKLDDMVKAYARRTGHHGWVPSLSVPGPQMAGLRAGFALPGPGAVRGVQTFAEWLAAV